MTLNFEPRRDLIMAFATPLAQMTLEEAESINPALESAILQREATDPGTQRSNAGGWHSRDDLLDWDLEAVGILRQAMVEAVHYMMTPIAQGRSVEMEVKLHAWANVSRRGAFNAPHNHAKAYWSGVYYVNAGRPDPGQGKNGMIELQDPRGRSEMAGTPLNPFGQTMAVPPRNGLMILFPSWLYHWVNPYQGEGHRISIAFNGTCENVSVKTS